MKHDIEAISAAVHDSWMKGKRDGGVRSRKAEDGEELMVPYHQLSDKQKDQDRQTVHTVIGAMNSVHGDSMQKKPGIDVVIGVGKPRLGGPPKPPDGLDGAPMAPDDSPDDPDQQEGDDIDTKLDKIYACLQKIEKALGLDEEDQPEEGDGAPPPDAMTSGAPPR